MRKLQTNTNHWELQIGNYKLSRGARSGFVREIPFLRRRDGFTLIELLIVIVIIGILSTLVIANFVGVRARARDAQRKTDLSQIRTALQLYYSDEGQYPSWTTATSPDCGEEFGGDTGVTYIKEMPCDPKTPTQKYTYNPLPNSSCGVTVPCSGYQLIACLENTSDADTDESRHSSCPNNTASITVFNP